MKLLKQTLLWGTSMATAISALATISPTQAQTNRLLATSNEPIASIEATPLVAANNLATLESEIIAEINRVRTHPSEYADWLETLRPYFDGNRLEMPGEEPIAVREGIAALEEAIRILRVVEPRLPLANPGGINSGTKNWVQVMGDLGLQSNQDPNGRNVGDYINEHGRWQEYLVPLNVYGKRTAAAVVLQLVLSDGYVNREPRQELMSEDYYVGGVGCGNHNTQGTMCTIALTAGYTDSNTAISPPETSIDFEKLAQEIFTETNRARTNPEAYAEELESRIPYYQGENGKVLRLPDRRPIQLVEGLSAVNEAIDFLWEVEPVGELNNRRGLALAALEQAECLEDKYPSHVGCDGSGVGERLNKYGTWESSAGENIAAGSETAQDFVLQWIIDDGVADRGHRETLFDPDFQVTGVSCGPHLRYRIICVATYATGYEDVE